MKLPKVTLSIAALIAANLVPLAGVLLFGWDAGAIVLLYWAENLVVGFYTVLKIVLAPVPKPSYHLGKLFLIAFFYLHFGLFCGVHGALLAGLFNLGEPFPKGPDWPFPVVFFQVVASLIAGVWRSRPPGVEWPVISLFASHGVSFVQNHLVRRERASLDEGQLMIQPYGRIVLMHVTILAGALPVMLLGSPVPLLVVLIGLKIAVDIALHKRSHGRIGQGPPALLGRAAAGTARRRPRG
jgi:hypothetical protein